MVYDVIADVFLGIAILIQDIFHMIYNGITGSFRGIALLTQSLIQMMCIILYCWRFPWHSFTDPEPNQYDVWWYYWRFPWCKTSVQWYVLLSQPSASTT